MEKQESYVVYYDNGATGTFLENPSSREINVSVLSMPLIF